MKTLLIALAMMTFSCTKQPMDITTRPDPVQPEQFAHVFFYATGTSVSGYVNISVDDLNREIAFVAAPDCNSEGRISLKAGTHTLTVRKWNNEGWEVARTETFTVVSGDCRVYEIKSPG